MSGTAGTAGSSGAGGAGGFAGASSLGDCQSSTYGGHTYVFCDVKVTWTAARDNCASVGMQLARVDDAGENTFLGSNFYASPPLQGMWLDATDAAVEGEWRWADNGDLFWLGDKAGSAQNGLYSGWYPGSQPSATTAVRDCVLMDINNSSHDWYDADCSFTQQYVCESL
jgi:hypothetical protein